MAHAFVKRIAGKQNRPTIRCPTRPHAFFTLLVSGAGEVCASRTSANAASATAFGAIAAAKSSLIAMAAKHGRDLRLVDPRYTSMDCSHCGARAKHRPSLSERTYACWSCGVVLPRDKNSAAIMVVRAGFVPAGAEGTSPVPQLAASAV